MLCVICLQNKASLTVVCGDCDNLNLPNHNKHVETTISKRLMELPMDRQLKIVRLTHKRFDSLVKINLSKEFTLNLVLKEYLDMEENDDDIDMAMSDRSKRESHWMSYPQYKSPRRKEQI